MKIVIAPDSFKESLSALQAAREIEAGFRQVFPHAQYVLLPMADGGEGTAEALATATGGRVVESRATGPLGEPLLAHYGISGDGATAIVEMAAASGLALVPRELRDPLKTTSYGTGELIRAALDAGARHLVVGIGGSATNDGGAGMLQALGVRLLDASGNEIGFGGGSLASLERIDARGIDPRLKGCRIEAACDVDNPLTGPAGASAVFGPQKGASPAMVARLDANLARFAALIRRDLGVEVESAPGAGAAGGTGAALLAFLGAQLLPGIEIVMRTVGFEDLVADADLVITGEGCIDGQTVRGKAPVGVARVAKRHGKPVIGLAGSLGEDAGLLHREGIDAVFCVVQGAVSLEKALARAAVNLRNTARNVAAAVKLGLALPGR